LFADKYRNRLICSDVIREATANGDNVCIVLVSRIAHGEDLYNELDSILSPAGVSVGFIHSGMGEKTVEASLEDFEDGKTRVLIATYKMLAEGFDYKPANRLFLTAPVKDRTLIEQAAGRIERVYPGKEDAIIFDYVDNKVSVLANQASERLAVYKAEGNPIYES